jgi:hypothetical protein
LWGKSVLADGKMIFKNGLFEISPNQILHQGWIFAGYKIIFVAPQEQLSCGASVF